MRLLHDDRRRRRAALPGVECLDARITPTAIHPAITAQSAAMVSASAKVEIRREKMLFRLIERQENAIGREELRLAAVEARHHAHHHAVHASAGALADPPSVALAAGVRRKGSSLPSMASAPATSHAKASARAVSRSKVSASAVSVSKPGSTLPVLVPAPPSVAAPNSPATSQPASSVLPASVAQVLANVYQAFEQNPTGFSGSDFAQLVVISGDNLGIEVHDSNPADYSSLVAGLVNAGMQISASDPTYDLVVGLLPIAQLPTVATFSPTVAINAQAPASLQ
jgi:hypothetical protein